MYNAHEQLLRHKLDKMGYSLVKFRTRKGYPACLAGRYMIVDSYINGLVAGGAQWFEQLTLDEVEDWISERE